MDSSSHFSGALWIEFKSLNYLSKDLEVHEELYTELLSLFEICKVHFDYEFTIPKAE